MEHQTQNCNGHQSDLQISEIAVVMVPLTAHGHINQLLHLSTIITSYGLQVHFAGSTTHNRQAKVRFNGRDSKKTLSKIHFHDFDLPPYSTPPPNPDLKMPLPLHVGPLLLATLELRQPVCELVRQLSVKHKRVIVVHDMFMAYVAQDVKQIANAEAYALFAFSAFSLFSDFWEKIADKPFELDPDVFPSRVPVNDLPVFPGMDDWALKQVSLWGTETGRLYDTSRVIEGRYVELLERLKPELKHFAIGPFNPVKVETSGDENRHRCLQWLDKQEKSSVIYISFGTTVSQTDEQIAELATGFERSEQKFMWVLRRADTGNIFKEEGNTMSRLPEGYEERVRDRGIVVRDYAPQPEILAHPSTGGFMSHCGWNSCMESISTGVPIAAWPIHTDQPKNAVLVTEILKIGTMVCDSARRNELVTSSAVENAVRKLMASGEGKEMRKRAIELGEAVRGSVAKGGASSLEMDAFIGHITR